MDPKDKFSFTQCLETEKKWKKPLILGTINLKFSASNPQLPLLLNYNESGIQK